jgi:sporulation protein YlmC with PRC-barrel domain
MTYDTPRTRMTGGSAVAARPWNLIGADTIVGRQVIGLHDEKIGTIGDLYLDYDEHTARYASIDIGGFLGIGTKTVLIPFEVLQWSGDDLYLPAGKEVIGSAPEFDPMSTYDRTYEQTVLSNWGADAYWAQPGYGEAHSHWREGYEPHRDIL